MVLDPEDHDTWSAGSFFTNPVLDEEEFTAFLARVDRAPGRRRRGARLPGGGGPHQDLGGLADRPGGLRPRATARARARISTKHTLALTNRGEASTEDLLALAREVRDGVHAAFGVTLVNEPVTVGCAL